MSEIEDEVCRKIQERAELGLSKYGVTLADDTLSIDELLTHAQEEAMDFAIYIETVKRKMEEFRLHHQLAFDKVNFAVDRLDKAGFREINEEFYPEDEIEEAEDHE